MTPLIEMAAMPATNQALQKEFYDEKERELFEKEYEMVNGDPEAIRMGSSKHSGVGTRLIIRGGAHVEANKLGAVYGPDATFQIGNRERMPDISFLSAARIPEEGETEEKWNIVPDLAVEVVSPNETWEKVNDKILEYFDAGVRQVWLISLKHRRVYIYDSLNLVRILTEENELTSEELLPGFRCRIGDLFKQPARAS
ncbi:MAG: Uma2 family endonuclease [Blastocatellia bacterium]